MKCGWLLSVSLAGCAAGAQELSIEPSRSEIVVSDGARVAADELALHLGLITGKRVPIVVTATPGSYVWHVGEAPAGTGAMTNHEEAHWRIGRDAAWFYGGACDGTRHAVMSFLEEALGVRWPFGTNIFYTATSRLRIANTAGDWVPTLRSRQIRPGPAPDAPLETRVWAMRMREGVHDKPPYGHAFTRYWEKYAKTHPEFFAMRPDGKRMPFDSAFGSDKAPEDPAAAAGMSGAPFRRMAMCPSSEGLSRQIIGQWLSGGTNEWINLCENDARGSWSCRCEGCRALDEPPVKGHPMENLDVWYADRYVRFANKLLRSARQYRPDAKVSMYAYFGTQEAPRRERLDEGIVVGIVPIDFTFAGMAEYLDSWKKAGLRTFFYRPNRHWYFRAPETPLGCERYFFDGWKYLYGQGAIGFDYDSPGNVSAFEWFRDYVIAKAMQDPAKDFAYWEDHYMQAFGAAAEDVKAYFRHWREEVWERRIMPDFGRYEDVMRKGAHGSMFFRQLQNDIGRYYRSEDYEKTDAMLEAGLSRADLSEPARRNLQALLTDNRKAGQTFRKWGNAVPVMQFGWSNSLPDDATAMVRLAIGPGGCRIYLDKRDKDWVVRPFTITRSDVEILVDADAVVRTPEGDTDLGRIFRVGKNAQRVRVVRKGM